MKIRNVNITITMSTYFKLIFADEPRVSAWKKGDRSKRRSPWKAIPFRAWPGRCRMIIALSIPGSPGSWIVVSVSVFWLTPSGSPQQSPVFCPILPFINLWTGNQILVWYDRTVCLVLSLLLLWLLLYNKTYILLPFFSACISEFAYSSAHWSHWLSVDPL